MNDDIRNIAIGFYDAFSAKNISVQEDIYHGDLEFADPAFGRLNRKETLAMWQMLFEASDDLEVKYEILSSEADEVTVRWTAHYSFGKKRRKVINHITAQLEIKDSKIIKHTDKFNLHRWATQALGLPGLLLGWTSFFKKRLQNQTRQRLNKYMLKLNAQ